MSPVRNDGVFLFLQIEVNFPKFQSENSRVIIGKAFVLMKAFTSHFLKGTYNGI